MLTFVTQLECRSGIGALWLNSGLARDAQLKVVTSVKY
jgi:hypothetical protein